MRIAVVSGTYSLNGFPPPAGREWSVSMWDAPNLIAQARAAQRAGADIVIAKYHGGDEYSAMPNAQQVALARALTASPYVDVVVGEHAHVVQPITRVNGKWVVYGLGNAVAQSEVSRPRAYEGITVAFAFRETRHRGFVVDRAEYVPTLWNHYASGRPIRVQRVVQALARGVSATSPAARGARRHPRLRQPARSPARPGAAVRRLLAALVVAAGLTVAAPAYACACGGLVDQPGRDTSVTSETALVVWDGETETIVLRLSTRTDAVSAGLLVPTPSPATAELGDDQVFTDLADVTAPRPESRWHLFGPPLLGGGGGDDTRRADRAAGSRCWRRSTSVRCAPRRSPPRTRPPCRAG